MAEVQLNIVAFRFRPAGASDDEVDGLNREIADAMLAHGRFLVGTSRLDGRTIFRPAFSNWRIRPEDVDEFVDELLATGRGRCR